MEIQIKTKSNGIHPYIVVNAMDISNDFDIETLLSILKVTNKINEECLDNA